MLRPSLGLSDSKLAVFEAVESVRWFAVHLAWADVDSASRAAFAADPFLWRPESAASVEEHACGMVAGSVQEALANGCHRAGAATLFAATRREQAGQRGAAVVKRVSTSACRPSPYGPWRHQVPMRASVYFDLIEFSP